MENCTATPGCNGRCMYLENKTYVESSGTKTFGSAGYCWKCNGLGDEGRNCRSCGPDEDGWVPTYLNKNDKRRYEWTININAGTEEGPVYKRLKLDPDKGNILCNTKNDGSLPKLVVNYDEIYNGEREGENIRPEDEVVAENGMWFSQAEIPRFRLKNSERAPTYGNCMKCCDNL